MAKPKDLAEVTQKLLLVSKYKLIQICCRCNHFIYILIISNAIATDSFRPFHVGIKPLTYHDHDFTTGGW